jgi:dCTP deaminase
MILTGKQIQQELNQKIFIEPYRENQLGPNSYNLRLHEDLACYTELPLDMKKDNPIHRFKIPKEGFLLEPGVLYLGRTVERTRTEGLVPMLEGRSSIGRLGICIHVTAGFGDVGFDGFWTLEITVVLPVLVYPNVEVCQIYYHSLLGETTNYSSKYQKNQDIQSSMLYKDFLNGRV